MSAHTSCDYTSADTGVGGGSVAQVHGSPGRGRTVRGRTVERRTPFTVRRTVRQPARSDLLAQALIGSPSLLVLDEPAAGLDPDERLRLREILGERRRTSTVLIATHLTDEAAICDAVIVLGESTIKFSGTPAQLAARASGQVWVQDRFPPPDVRASWQQADSRHRCLGQPPEGAELVEPSLEEGYLIVQDLRTATA